MRRIGEAGPCLPRYLAQAKPSLGGGHEPTPNPVLGVGQGMACTALGGVVCGDSCSVHPATLTLVPRVFFNACDGLFTNYNWKEEHLERTRMLAGPRHTDVYVGIDVFARGDVIGGGFDTDKVAVPGLGSELPPMAVLCHAVPCQAANPGMQQ